jgi:hypothetical protein
LIDYPLDWKNKKINGNPGAFPHLRDELACTATVRRLSLDDCRRLFPLIRTASNMGARQRVASYLAVSTPAGQMALHLPG